MGPSKLGWKVVLNVLAAGPEWWSLLASQSLVKTDSLLCEHFHEMSDEIRTVPGYGENSFLSGTE